MSIFEILSLIVSIIGLFSVLGLLTVIFKAGSWKSSREEAEEKNEERLEEISGNIEENQEQIMIYLKNLASGHNELHREINGDDLDDCDACNLMMHEGD